MELSIANVVNVSVNETQAGIGEYNTSNQAIFTRETPNESFGDLGYAIYLSPDEVATDFGSDSDTFAMANAIFSQQPNILAGGGYLVVITFADTDAVVAQQTITLSAVPASGGYLLNYGGDVTTEVADGVDAAALQVLIRTLTGLGSATVTGSEAAGFVVTMTGVSGAAALMTVTSNSLQTATPVNVTVSIATTRVGTTSSTEDLATAITRTKGIVQYFGIMAAEITGEADMLEAAAVVQPLNKVAFFVSRNEAAVADGGLLDLLTTGGFTQSRGLFYGADTDAECLVMMASYAGRALSTNFNGSNTTQNMHLKDLTGVQADPSMTEALLVLCQAAGADVYASFQGVAKVFCSGANKFFDQTYNLRWFVGAIEVAGFNFLAQSATKTPQTESGMDALKGSYRAVCELAVTNGYVAPGAWNSSTTFGNQANFLANVSQRGYYIFSLPISQQSQANREARIAPLVQIAIKEAGAIDKSYVVINVNA